MSGGYGARGGSAGGYGSRSSSGGDRRPTKSHGGGGVLDHLGVVGNLVKDAEGAVLGLPMGVKTLVTHPIAAAENIGKGYAQTYAPLFHGDVRGFAHGVAAHPLNPLLDLFALVTLGGGGLARAGGALSEAGAIADTSRLAHLADTSTLTLRSPAALAGERAAGVVEKTTSRNPVIRARQTVVHDLLGRLPYETPVLGEMARYGRQLRRAPAARASVMKQLAEPYMNAFAKLSKTERRALAVLGRVPLPEHLDTWKQLLDQEAKTGNHEAGKLLDDISDPRVMKAYLNPSKAMMAAHAEADKLGQHAAGELERLGVLTKQQAEGARYRHSRIGGGADVYTVPEARAARRRLDSDVRALAKTQAGIEKRIGELRERGTPELRAVRNHASKTATMGAKAAAGRQKTAIAEERYQAQIARELTAAQQRVNSAAEKASAARGRLGGQVSSKMRQLEQAHDQLLNALTHPTRAYTSSEITDRVSKVTAIEAELKELQQAARTARRKGGELAGEQANPAAAALRSGRPPRHKPPAAAADVRALEAAVHARQIVELHMLQTARDDVASRILAGRAELPRLAELEQTLAAKAEKIQPGIVGGPDTAAIRSQLEQAGRPQPLYLPDVPATPAARGASGGAFSYGNPVHRADGVLFSTGRLALDPDVLGPQFLRTVVFSHYRDLHDLLLDSAIELQKGSKLPAGYTWVKRPLGVDEAPKLHQLVPNPNEIPSGLRDLTSIDRGDALIDHGARYAVPVKLARQMEAEFQRGSQAARWLLDKPTQVWRALVLNLRIGWLTNNIIGNHLLYALRYAGPSGLRGYLGAIATTKGADVARRLLDLPETRKALTADDIAELLPEQAGGTFIGSQAPTRLELPLPGGRTANISRAARVAGAGLAKVDKGVEGTLRRGATNAELRAHPAVKARLRAMDKETRSFRDAAKQALADDPKLAREISDRVNSALGDFLDLSPFERRYLRAVFPFYAWYKAISKIVFKLPLDYPGRTSLLAKLDQVGLQDSTDQLGELPSYLKGAIPLGGDELLKTQGLNPLATVPQLARAAAVPFVPGARTNELAGTMNPFVQALGALIFGKQATQHGLAADLATGIFTDLPQVGLARTVINGPQPSKLYQPSAVDDLLAFLGAPTKTINRRRARQLAQGG